MLGTAVPTSFAGLLVRFGPRAIFLAGAFSTEDDALEFGEVEAFEHDPAAGALRRDKGANTLLPV